MSSGSNGIACCGGVCHGESGSFVCVCLNLGWPTDFRVCFHEDLCVGCCVRAQMYLSVCCASAGWGYCCAMFVHTRRGSCNSWGSRIERTVGLLEGGDVTDSVQCRNGVSPEVKESRKGRRSWREQGGRTGVEEGWASEGKGGMRHWEKGKRRTLQGIKLDISPQKKVWRDGQNKGRGTHRGPGGSWMLVQD